MKIDLRKKILLFDFDGTIVETEYLAKEAILQYFDENNLSSKAKITEMFSDMIVGRTWSAAIDNMIQHAKTLGITLDSSENLAREFKTRYRARVKEGVRLIPGFLDVLPKIKSLASFVGIVTGSEHDEVEAILKVTGLGNDFDRVWAYGDYAHSKPDPSPYLTAMKAISADPKDVLVFEDSRAGMESAHRAGLPWVQIAHEAHAFDPDPRSLLVIKNWHDLKF
ncbi:MAG: HAD family phosphatase [Bdellovibrionales bacterium]|nr:HAD family phosphatase [Bdellovibrionales bacterium]